MDKGKIVASLRETYGVERAIICLPEENPTEIICELIKNTLRDHSSAIAVVQRSAPHYHRVLTEIYEIEEGAIHLHLDDRMFWVGKGETFIIPPLRVHWVESVAASATIHVVTSPIWTPEDHILVPESEFEERYQLVNAMLDKICPFPPGREDDEDIERERQLTALRAGWGGLSLQDLRRVAAN